MLRWCRMKKRVKKTIVPAKARRTHARSAKKSSRPQRSGKVGARARSGGDSSGTVGPVRGPRPLGRLLAALQREEIQFILIGMSAAIAQGVIGTTLDVDLWINLPPRQYMTVL